MRPIEAATIHSATSMSAATSAAITARSRLPCKICASVFAIRNGCRVRKKSRSLSVTGRSIEILEETEKKKRGGCGAHDPAPHDFRKRQRWTPERSTKSFRRWRDGHDAKNT